MQENVRYQSNIQIIPTDAELTSLATEVLTAMLQKAYLIDDGKGSYTITAEYTPTMTMINGKPINNMMVVILDLEAIMNVNDKCYKQDKSTPATQWVRTDIPTINACYAADTCHTGNLNGDCYKWAITAVSAAKPWNVAPPAPVAAAPATTATQFQCYWMENVSGQFKWVANTMSKQDCYRMDSCNGGMKMSGGGCYKWAASPTANPEPW
jgi:hypothetical protein